MSPRFPSAPVPFSAHLGWNHTHQQPPQTPLCFAAKLEKASHVDESTGLIVYATVGSFRVREPASQDSAASAKMWPSSTGALIMGQWPESMSTNDRFLTFASSGASPASIQSLAWVGVNSGHTITTGTP